MKTKCTSTSQNPTMDHYLIHFKYPQSRNGDSSVKMII